MDYGIVKEAEYRLQQVIQRDKPASLGAVVAGVVHEINNKGLLRPVDINEVIQKAFVLVGTQVRKSVARWEINLGKKLLI